MASEHPARRAGCAVWSAHRGAPFGVDEAAEPVQEAGPSGAAAERLQGPWAKKRSGPGSRVRPLEAQGPDRAARRSVSAVGRRW
jgi:hypothetical protein